VCHLVALRGATLAAAAIAGLLRVMGRDGAHTAMQPTAIVVDGGLFAHYGAFRGCAGRPDASRGWPGRSAALRACVCPPWRRACAAAERAWPSACAGQHLVGER
jgi:hypothetical protein